MDRAVLQDHLAAAEQYLDEAEWHVANQREHVSQLERDGIDTTEPVRLLAELEEVLALHLADRDRLREELGV